jgi:hypothetical protein
MKEPHKKGVADPLDPESCAGVGNHLGEALLGAHAGQPSSSEITFPGVPTLYGEGEGHIPDDDTCESSRNATESETLRMRGNSLHGNRETPKASILPSPPGGGRWDGTAREGPGPHAGHVRLWGVGRLHTTAEAGEQGRPLGRGVCGGKGADQGERLVRWARTGLSAGRAWPWTAGRTNHRIRDGSSWTRGKSRMR